jgi:hypothetical protein
VAGDVNLTGVETDSWQDEHPNGSRGGGTNSEAQASVADYLVYNLPERVTVADNETKQVGFLDLQGVKATKEYEFHSDSFSSGETPEHADSVVRFSNTASALPAGTVRVYMRDAAGEAKFVGENSVGHSPAGSDVAIKIGEAFDVTVQPTVVTAEKISKWRTRYAMSYAVRNAQATPATVEVRQGGLWRDSKVGSESLPSRRIDAHTLVWSVPVPAHGETVLTFQVESGS